jgi:hypothetical protein
MRQPAAAGLERADYIVVEYRPHAARESSGVLGAKNDDWLVQQGYEHIGIMGTSLGSCLSMLTMAHEPRLSAGAFNHVSPYFADVVWQGLSTRHVRDGLEGHIGLEALRDCWMPISPWPFISRIRGRALRCTKSDLTFPVDLSLKFVGGIHPVRCAAPVGILPCGHYTTAKRRSAISTRTT